MPASSTLLRLEGRDALAVLQRISTQKLDDLAAGEARVTLFCDYRGRLLHLAFVGRTEDAVWLARDDAPGAPLAEHIARHVFREDVRITDLSETHPVTPDVMGGGDIEESARQFEARPDQASTGWITVTTGTPTRIVVESAGALDLTGRAAIPDAELRRIETAGPRHGHEVSEEFTPFEVGLHDEVHLSKGCFTGQEVLLRLVTYGGQRRRLARVAGNEPVPAVPADLLRDGTRVGRLTSSIARGQTWIGLAVVLKEITGPEGVSVGGDAILFGLDPVAELRPRGLPA